MAELLPYAPLLASAIAIAAVLSGLWQFRTTQRLTREAKAVDLFLKFNELNEQLSQSQVGKTHDASFWQHNALVTITEAVFKLTKGDPSWEETVIWMLKSQQAFLAQNPINCQSFSPKFVERMKLAIPQLRCA